MIRLGGQSKAATVEDSSCYIFQQFHFADMKKLRFREESGLPMIT